MLGVLPRGVVVIDSVAISRERLVAVERSSVQNNHKRIRRNIEITPNSRRQTKMAKIMMVLTDLKVISNGFKLDFN